MNHQPSTINHQLSTINLQLIAPFPRYLIKFIGIFCLCYFGTLAVIGLASPSGHYSPFVAKYLDYVSWLKRSMINTTAFILSLFHIPTVKESGFALRIKGGVGIIISMSCVGYGVYSFWIAFVVANTGTFWKKVRWVLGGLLVLWLVNVTRITLLLLAINRGWPMPLGIDHHTWFNIVAYTLIIIFIVLYDRSSGNKVISIK
jgi:exosortase/archaeosortase family protein